MFSWFKKDVPPAQHVINYIEALDGDLQCKRFEARRGERFWEVEVVDSEGSPPLNIKKGIDQGFDSIDLPHLFTCGEEDLIIDALTRWDQRYWDIFRANKKHWEGIKNAEHMNEFIKSYG